jgi:chromosome partitioning protein
MGHIICVASQKGGTGKTTSAVNLAASLALLEKDTLLVDCDPLGNATTGMGVDKGGLSHDLFDAMTDRVSPGDILVDTYFDRLQVLPARVGLHHVQAALGSTPNPELVLRNVIRKISCNYEYTLIDSPPSFGFLTLSALASADHLLLPLQRQIFAFEGLSQLLLMIRGVQKSIHPTLKIAGIFYTMCRDITEPDPFSRSPGFSFLKNKLFKSIIPWDDNLSSAADQTRPVSLLDVLSKGSVAYMDLAQELVEVLASGH